MKYLEITGTEDNQDTTPPPSQLEPSGSDILVVGDCLNPGDYKVMKMRTTSATLSSSKMNSSGMKATEAVKVVVRYRPLNQKEVEGGHEFCVTMFPDSGLIETGSWSPVEDQQTFGLVRQTSFKRII